MGLSRLRSFVCLAEELHFGRAARLLHISQPALSQQIARLEKDLAAILLLRTNRVVRLTPAGHEFLKGARSALAILDDAAYAARFGRDPRKPLVLSHVFHPSSDRCDFLDAFCSALEEQIYDSPVHRVHHSMAEHTRALREGDAHLGLSPAGEPLESCGFDSAVIIPRSDPPSGAPEGGQDHPGSLRLSWPSWVSPAETEQLVSLARELVAAEPARRGDFI